jgi:hypothetical protein
MDGLLNRDPHPAVMRFAGFENAMKTLTAIVAFTVVFALLAADADAAKKRKRKYRAAPAPVTHVDRSGNVELCNGG